MSNNPIVPDPSQDRPLRRDLLSDPPQRDESTASEVVDRPDSINAPNSTTTWTEATRSPEGPSVAEGVGGGMLPTLMFLMALLVMAVVMGRVWLRRRRRRGSSLMSQVGEVRRWADAQLSESATPLLGAPAEIRRWHVEMERVSRDLRAELDTKIVLLQATMRAAAEESQRLERAVAQARQLGGESKDTIG